MYGRVLVGIVIGVAGACGGSDNPPLQGDAGMDAPAFSYSIAAGASAVSPNSFVTRAVTVTGYPNDEVIVSIDRATAGTIVPGTLTLDANGNGTTTYAPCSLMLDPNCVLGPATLRLALASAPDTAVADTQISLDGSLVSTATPCQAGGNVMFLEGNDYILGGTKTSSAQASWWVSAIPGRIAFQVDDGGYYDGAFSLREVPHALTPGTYEGAERESSQHAGVPGLEVLTPGRGCNAIDGRFQVHEYDADPMLGTLYSVTISFEQRCDGMPAMVHGCFHYETTPPAVPPTQPAPDPTKVSVQVFSSARDGAYDPNALVIFYDSSGAIVLDTQVNMFGQAEISLPTGGSVTTIQFHNGWQYLYTYRGLHDGDHVVVQPIAPNGGATDYMMAASSKPAGSTGMFHRTSCTGFWYFGSSSDLQFWDGCRRPTFDVLSVASFTSGPSQFAWHTGLTHVANGVLDFTSASWTPMSDATVTFTNIPASSPPIGARWNTVIDGTPNELGFVSNQTPSAGTQSMTFSYPPGAGDSTQVSVSIGGGFVTTSWEGRTVDDPTLPGAVTIDLSSQPLINPSAVQQTSTTVSWTETGSGTPDIREALWRALTPQYKVLWRVFEPHNGSTSTTLSLPAAHAAHDPTINTSLQLKGASVRFDDYDVLSGFSAQPPTSSYRLRQLGAATLSLSQPL